MGQEKLKTINDIAKIANVSKATVSKVINDYPDVNEKTKKKILKIMREHNYWPNATARSLSTNKSLTIGIFDPSRLNNFFFREVFEGVEYTLGENGYDILYFTNKRWGETWVEFSFTEKCHNRNVDGVLLMGFGEINSKYFNNLLGSDIPTVAVDLDIVGKNASYVMSDNFNGARIAVDYLYNLGHRKIGMIMGPSGFKPAKDRFLGFQTKVNELGLKYNSDWVLSGQYGQKTAFEYIDRILKLEERPTAIFSEDVFSIGIINALKKRKMSVPNDFSLVGFDNVELSEHYDLTTIDQNQFALGKAASELLLKILNKKNFSPVIMPAKLVERGSCLNLKE
ncbi:MAG: LacI family DNA-binding transcriptional regulator [Candidatus Woesearchaeota archaeon]